MRWRFRTELTESDVTPEEVFRARRKFMAAAAGAAITGALPGGAVAASRSDPVLRDEPTRYEDATSYNNFYEFGTGKGDPARLAGRLTISPWQVRVDGLVERPLDLSLDDLLKEMRIEERIYRFRCVEGWAMVVPWNGFMLRDLLEKAGVRKEARYVAFETLLRPSEMPGQKRRLLEWPYREGLRLDEAMHPLTLMATGMYGKPLPKQNGAPLRLVVPWKYGFKSIKSVVRITLTESQPPTTWNMMAPDEYGFYANVNPNVDHPRWSQATERLLGSGLFAGSRPTRMFNGYEEEVAELYRGMDLRKYF